MNGAIIFVDMEKPAYNHTVGVSGVSKSFNNTLVVDDISFDVEQSEILGLIGPNGAGKTTTIRMIMDIIKPNSGEISVLGETLKETTKNKIYFNNASFRVLSETTGSHSVQRIYP